MTIAACIARRRGGRSQERSELLNVRGGFLTIRVVDTLYTHCLECRYRLPRSRIGRMLPASLTRTTGHLVPPRPGPRRLIHAPVSRAGAARRFAWTRS